MKLLKLTATLSLTLALLLTLASCGASDRTSIPETIEDVEAGALVQDAPETSDEVTKKTPNEKYADFRAQSIEALEGVQNQPSSKKRSDKLEQVCDSICEEATEGICLSWSPVVYAEGYEVFHSTRMHGDYCWIARVEDGTAFTHLDPVEGKTNYYKVRAYKHLHGNMRRGNLSAPIAIEYSK